MELRAWQHCQRNSPVQCTGTLSLAPPSWDIISALYNQVLKVVSKFPGHRRLVLYFAYKGASVKVDLGDVRAAGALAILGLGIGLGTLFVYRLYHRYIRPFLDALQCPDPEDSVCSQLAFLLDSSDSGVDGAKGSSSDKQLSTLLNSVQYGVALGGKGQSPQPQTAIDSVRLRRTGTRRRPVRKSRTERDARAAGSSHLSPGFRDVSFRDSFYSTAESGFETLPECNEEEQDEREDAERFPRDMSSDREKVERYLSFSSADHSHSSPSYNKTVVDVNTLNNDENSEATLTVPHRDRVMQTAKSSPARKLGRSSSAGRLAAKRHSSYPHSLDHDYDPSLDASESIPSFNSSGEECSWEEEGKESCPSPPSQSAMTDVEFRESLMQRVHQWASSAEEYTNSPSPTPDRMSPMQIRQMRRSRSLDRHLVEPVFIPEVMSSSEQRDNLTIKHLECLETEFHDIQGEFESITSKLHDLIERGRTDSPEGEPCGGRPRPSPLPPHLQPRGCRDRDRSRSRSPLSCRSRRRTRWERMPRSGSRSSSRASSVDFSWDCGEEGGGRRDSGGGGGLLVGGVVGPGGDCGDSTYMQGGELCLSHDKEVKDSVVNVGEAVSIEEYTEREWKGETHKARTILQGYSIMPDLFHCQRLRPVRRDNYCALRGALFQVLSGGHPVTRGWPGPLSLIDQFHALYTHPLSGLDQWHFAGCPPWGGQDDRWNKMAFCFLTLIATIEDISVLPSQEEREKRAVSVLNDSQQLDSELMEGLKLMMLFSASHLHGWMGEGGEVPAFARALFARDASPDLVSLVRNRLNCVGDSAGVDQVELCLLAHTLGVRVHVADLHLHGQDDFVCTIPDGAPDTWPSICLMAEDGHYTVPAP